MSNSEYNKKELILKLRGKAFDDGIYIHTFIETLKEFQYILDRSYLTLSHRTKMTVDERKRYHLKAQEFKQGCLVSKIDIVAAASLVSSIGPDVIWEHTKLVFELLKNKFPVNRDEAISNSQTINAPNNQGNIYVFNGTQNIEVPAEVLRTAKQVLPSINRLMLPMKRNELESVHFYDRNQEASGIFLDFHIANRFEVKSEILEEVIIIECDIFKYNKRTGQGKLTVSQQQLILAGEYNFIASKQNLSIMNNEKIIIKCKREIEFTPLASQATRILKLHLLSIVS